MTSTIPVTRLGLRALRRVLPPLTCLVVFWAAGVLCATPWIRGDGQRYYAMALSLAKDGDLDLANQRAAAGFLRLWKGRWVTPYAPGFAMFYYPFVRSAVALAQVWEPVWRLSLSADPLSCAPLTHSLALLAGSLVWGSVALLASYAAASAILPPWRAAGVSAACFVGTHLFAYCVYLPSLSHALDAAIISLGVWALIAGCRHGGQFAHLRWYSAGFLFGVAVAVRLVNVGALVGALGVPVIAGETRRERCLGSAFLALGALAPAGVLLAYQLDTYGTLVGGGYEGALAAWPRHILEPLAARPHGLLLWSPFIALCFAGWVLAPKRVQPACILPFLGSVIAMGFYTRHARGAYYGGRYLIQFQLAYAVGLAAFLCVAHRLPALLRYVARAGCWLAFAYAIVLVPVAWLPCRAFRQPGGKATMEPSRMLSRFGRSLCEPLRPVRGRDRSFLSRLPYPPRRTLLTLMQRQWGPARDRWPPAVAALALPPPPVAYPRELTLGEGDDRARGWILTPRRPGWPTAVSFQVRCPEPGFRGPESWKLTVGSAGTFHLLPRFAARDAKVRPGVGCFMELENSTAMVHIVLARPSGRERIRWERRNASSPWPSPDVSQNVQARFLSFVWAAQGASVIEPKPPTLLQGPLHQLTADRRSLVAFEEVPEGGLSVQVSGGGAPAVVACIPLAWRGAPKLLVTIGRGTQFSLGPLGSPEPRIIPAGAAVWVGRPGWQHGSCLAVAETPGTGSARISIAYDGEPASADGVRVLLPGDAWDRHVRECVLFAGLPNELLP